MSQHYTTCLQSIPGRGPSPATLATLIAAAQRRVAALRDAGLPTTHAEQALARLEAENA